MVTMDSPCNCGENSWKAYKSAIILPEYEHEHEESLHAKSTGMPVNAYTCEKCGLVRLVAID